MDKSSPQPAIRCFSQDESVPADIRQTCLAIVDAGHDSFRTKGVSEEGAVTRTRWLEAWKNPQTGLWTVERRGTVSAKDSQGAVAEEYMPQETALRNVRFFDALYYCNMFENSERGAAADLKGDESVPHYGVAAEAAGQPFDKDGLLHPAAFGRILTPGVFDKEAYEIAAKTKGRDLIVPAEQASGDNNMFLVPAAKDAGIIALPKGMSRLEYVCMLRAVFNAAAEARNFLEKSVRQGDLTKSSKRKFWYTIYKADHDAATPGPFLLSVFTLGAFYPVYCTVRYSYTRFRDARNAPERFFESHTMKLDALIGKMPKGQEKELFQKFSAAATGVLKLEKAAAIYQQCKKTGDIKRLKEGQSLIRKAAGEAGLDVNINIELEQAYLEDRFPAPGHFYKKLDAEFKILEKAIQPALNSLS